MASLTHVCMWSDNGWKRITAEEAAILHPGGTVSAHSGLFMCELCGQYVILTDGYIMARHFRHSAYEKSKDCPERTFGANYYFSYRSDEHELPIRITLISPQSFGFEIGLIRAPVKALSKNFCIQILPNGLGHEELTFSKERLNYVSITYLPIGEQPYGKYILNFQNGTEKLREFWPREVKGIDPAGTLFDKASGIMLPYDADVEIDKEYFLLMRGYYCPTARHGLSIKEVAQKSFTWEKWTLYTVSACEFNEGAARFFLDYHARLTDHPISIQPVWPLFVEDSFVCRHNQKRIYIFVRGNTSSLKAFPVTSVRRISEEPKLYEVSCAGRQQLISAGRTRALQYTYFWKEPLDKEGAAAQVAVTDLSGEEIPPGELNVLPQGKVLRILSQYDGEIVLSFNGNVVEKRKLRAGKIVELCDLAWGLDIQVIIGLDCVWEILCTKKSRIAKNNESALLMYISNTAGMQISAPHSLRNILVGMGKFPLLSRWIRNRIKEGTINEQAYRRLQYVYHNMNTNKQGDIV